MQINKILICTDGEDHTLRAEDHAISLAKQTGAEIVCVHVVNPFLKKFVNEIYAVGRNECMDHIDASLQREGDNALNKFSEKAASKGMTPVLLMKYGDPEQEILSEIENGAYDMVIMGAKQLTGWKKNFESFNLPEKIFKKSSVSMTFIR